MRFLNGKGLLLTKMSHVQEFKIELRKGQEPRIDLDRLVKDLGSEVTVQDKEFLTPRSTYGLELRTYIVRDLRPRGDTDPGGVMVGIQVRGEIRYFGHEWFIENPEDYILK